jgi:stage V sporulation protein T
VILKKYSPIGELGDIAKEYADSLYEAIGHIACIADRDTIIAVSGAPKKEFLISHWSGRRTSNGRKTFSFDKQSGGTYSL